MRRFSRGSQRNSGNSNTSPQISSQQQQTNLKGQPGAYTPPLSSAPNGGAIGATEHHNSRPVSAASDSSFDVMNRPMSMGGQQTLHGGVGNSMPGSAIGGLSRTDQVVLRYFWEDKYQNNAKRDLHFVSIAT